MGDQEVELKVGDQEAVAKKKVDDPNREREARSYKEKSCSIDTL